MSWHTELCCACTLQTHCSPLNLSYLHELKGALGFKLHTGISLDFLLNVVGK